MDGVKQPQLLITHPAADPAHPDHDRLITRITNALAEFGLAIAVDAVTHGVIRIGPLANKKQ